MLECSCHIISYLADVMNALRQSSGQGSSALLVEGEEKAMEVDSDWVEELAVEEDDSQAEDSVRITELMSACNGRVMRYDSVIATYEITSFKWSKTTFIH